MPKPENKIRIPLPWYKRPVNKRMLGTVLLAVGLLGCLGIVMDFLNRYLNPGTTAPIPWGVESVRSLALVGIGVYLRWRHLKQVR